MPRPRSRVRYNLALNAPLPRLASRVIPSVDPWLAGEMFVSPHVEERRRGFAILFGSEAARRSPLTHQLLAARVDEPDLSLRAQIVHALADYFEMRGRDYRYPPEIRSAVTNHLRKFDRAQVMSLIELQRANHDGAVKAQSESLAHLLERVPNASTHLARLAADRAVALGLRRAAIEVIGVVGFTDALAPLEGLEARLEGRRAGQMTMTFAPTDNPDDQKLLPALKETLRALRDDE
ncbi:MAG TPA: hypothetical protein VI793_02400 [Anaerolineales bacterium]|nr:hypothetical protein [Anaerolineales bacterium]